MGIPNKFFVLEMANNHMGDVNHGIKIIKEFSKITKKYPFNFGFKLQYRDLDTFIHKDLKNRDDIKYIKRFKETRLNDNDFKKIISSIRKNNFVPICTPFDEKSVDKIVKHNFDIIKIASCSFTDWPLIEKINSVDKSIIASTAGATLEDIEKVVRFFKNRSKNFALMHCVAEYPTQDKKLNLNRIKYLINKFPNLQIGYSTHENPNDDTIVSLAIAMGTKIFEKHVGLPTNKYKLNKYSATPTQIDKWLKTAKTAYERCGNEKDIFHKNNSELNSLQSLKRGLFVRKLINKGKAVKEKDIYFAFPPHKNQITSDKFSKYATFVSKKKILKDKPLLTSNCFIKNDRKVIETIIEKTRKILKKSNQFFKGRYDFEISHHYGLEKFNKYGLVLLTVLNREYCKKILVIFPGQKHPEQWHKVKEETFHVLHGNIKLRLNGSLKDYSEGSLITIKPGVKHEFSSKHGSVVEEISTTHIKKDSFYTDKKIMKNLNRKTNVSYYWDN